MHEEDDLPMWPIYAVIGLFIATAVTVAIVLKLRNL